MIDSLNLGLFLVTAGVLALAPGPSTLLVLSHALTGDLRRPFSLIIGALLGNLVLIAVTVLGLASLILASQNAFTVLRWIGAAYLIWLGFSYWRNSSGTTTIQNASDSEDLRYRTLTLQAFMTSVTNPKGLVFYFAFLPQFAPAGDPWGLSLFGLAYLSLFMAALALYAACGHRLAGVITGARFQIWKNRITGGLLMAAGLSLLRTERS